MKRIHRNIHDINLPYTPISILCRSPHYTEHTISISLHTGLSGNTEYEIYYTQFTPSEFSDTQGKTSSGLLNWTAQTTPHRHACTSKLTWRCSPFTRLHRERATTRELADWLTVFRSCLSCHRKLEPYLVKIDYLYLTYIAIDKSQALSTFHPIERQISENLRTYICSGYCLSSSPPSTISPAETGDTVIPTTFLL